jgi:endo-1,4-beta-xylanase
VNRLKTFFPFLSLIFLVAPISAAEPTSLKDAYGKMFQLGVALPANGLTEEEGALVLRHFTNITTENCLKPQATQPHENKYDFTQGDTLVDWAEKNHLRINGHTLVWHNATPDWFFKERGGPASRYFALKRMREHIETVMRHYQGRIYSWDVVNEALGGTPADYLRGSKWKQCVGDDYVTQAYLAALKADPGAKLYYNDYGIEQPPKRANVIRLVGEIRAAGGRVDGIGIQGHYRCGQVPMIALEQSIVAFHDLGLQVMITELDVDVVSRYTTGADASTQEKPSDNPYPTACPPEILQQQANDYAALFRLFRKHADKITRVTFWNLHDGRSWLNHWPTTRTNYPLLWDRQLQPKPAYQAVLDVAAEPLVPIVPPQPKP